MRVCFLFHWRSEVRVMSPSANKAQHLKRICHLPIRDNLLEVSFEAAYSGARGRRCPSNLPLPPHETLSGWLSGCGSGWVGNRNPMNRLFSQAGYFLLHSSIALRVRLPRLKSKQNLGIEHHETYTFEKYSNWKYISHKAWCVNARVRHIYCWKVYAFSLQLLKTKV